MTQLRKFRDSISNYFDTLTQGLGKRGSSFMDLDAVSHDKDTGRFLFQEFKEKGEALHPAQRMVLRDLAGLPRCTVWCVRRIEYGFIGWGRFGSGRLEEVITEGEYQRRFSAWWSCDEAEATVLVDRPAHAGPSQASPLTAADISW